MTFKLLFLFLFIAYALPVNASELQKPTGTVLLTLTGNIKAKNTANAAVFDLKMLEELGFQKVITKTPWHKKTMVFEGPRGDVLLEKLGVTQGMMFIKALNDYVAKVPVEDFFKTGAILAMKGDGKFLSIRNKGPLFLIFPFDQSPDLKNDSYYTKSVWQIKSIHIE